VNATTRLGLLGCLCLCCWPGCSGSSTSSPSDVLGGTSGSGGNTPAVGGTALAETGGKSAAGGASASTRASGGLGTGAVATGGRAAGGVNTSGVATSTSKATGGASTGSATASTSTATAGTSAGGTASSAIKATGGASTGSATASGGTATAGRSAGGASAGGASAGGGSASGGGSAGGGSGARGGSSASSVCPPGITHTITVAKDGSGDYKTVQSAVDSIASNGSAPVRINIKAGTYTEKLTIAGRSQLCLVGDSAATTVLTYNDSNSSVGSTSGSASVYVSANDFSATQLTFQNSYGAGSQAVALRTTGQRQQFRDCRFVGYQDTLYVHSGTQYFRNCYVQGNTDYVFGGATAILQDCEVRNVQSGSAVAAPNTASSTAYGIVFLGGQFTAASGVSNVALARPWGADGAAAFLNANLAGHISAAGFTSMSGNDPAQARFSEYQSTGAGANPSGRSSYQMTATQAATYTVATIYGGAWTPSYSQ